MRHMDPMIIKVRSDLDEANQDISRLQCELSEAQRRAKKFREFLALYEDPGGQELHGQAPVPLPRFIPNAEPASTPIEESNTIKAKVVRIVSQLLADGQPRKTRDLLDEITRQGVVIGAKEKLLALSAILSKDGRFEPDRSLGWTLKK